MDYVSYNFMRRFARRFFRRKRSLSVCDVGSMDVNGTFRSMFSGQNYIGIDVTNGPNVDVVVEHYEYPFKNETFDAVISGSTLEHVRDIYKWIIELARILKKDGWMCIVAPAQFMHHPHPIDCWRIYPEGMKFLLGEVAGLKVDSVSKRKMSKCENICMGIAQK